MSIAATCASLVAVAVAMCGAAWSLYLFSAWGAPEGYVSAASVGMLVVTGVAAFVLTRRFVDYLLEPIRSLAGRWREASFRPRDHISLLRDQPEGDLESYAPEVRDLVVPMRAVLRKIEQRHERQVAWFGSVVHDVKTPVAASANALGALALRQSLQGSEEGELIQRVSDELRTLALSMQKVIDAIRFDREDLELSRHEIDLVLLARKLVDRVSVSRCIDISVEGGGTAVGDAALLERALENLILNAVRYARHSVKLTVYPGLVRIADDGHGLPAPLEYLTQPFRSKALDVGGHEVAGGAGGIGLFVARRVLEVHGGRLVVEGTSSHGTVLLAYIGRSNDA